MKVLFFADMFGDKNPSNDFNWYYEFKFNERKRVYLIDNPLNFEQLCSELGDLVSRLEIEKSIDDIVITAERYIDDDINQGDNFNFTICRDDCEIDTYYVYDEVLEAEWTSDIIEIIEKKLLEASGAKSIK